MRFGLVFESILGAGVLRLHELAIVDLEQCICKLEAAVALLREATSFFLILFEAHLHSVHLV